jgi:hypothetical protein
MECQDVRMLLAFVDRKCAELDAPEREAVAQHLESCPLCTELAHAERRADETLGAILRDVPVPADLKLKVMQRLTADRAAAPWKWMPWKPMIAAAAILLAVTSGVAWFFLPPPELHVADVEHVLSINKVGNWDENSAKNYLKNLGMSDHVPGQFDYRYLQDVDVITIKGRSVARLTFAKADECKACVLILPWNQFRTNELHDDATSIKIQRDEENKVTHLILFIGNIDPLYRKLDLY